jgi:predicted XRE-type DNA-binding protein
MKKRDPRLDDKRITHGSGNIFLDLGFEPGEAHVLFLRAELMVALQRHIESQGWTQAQAAKRMGITQPRVSKLKKGKWDEFSLDMLLTLAARIGMRMELRPAA